ncbi:MAG: DUF484 family protein [Gammaproteobacteria bacterium]|nr:DUF484 family protein [Gammaproteobacteria bacterium]
MQHNTDPEVKKLQRQISTYVDNAKYNEQKLRRFQEQELQFIKTAGIEALLEAFYNDYRLRFELDTVGLLLLDEDYEIRRILENQGISKHRYKELMFTDDASSITTLFDKRLAPRLGSKMNDCYNTLFANQLRRPFSLAVIPLVRHGQVIGCFHVGSMKARRFTPDTATDFLQRLVEIFAVCLENAINNEKIKLLGLLDPLTGIHNRRYLDQRLSEEVSRSMRQKKSLSCLFMDIDHFKSFNDTYGHAIGDLVLQEVANLIKSQMRLSDVLGRVGGEEFAILLTHTAKPEALEIAERIRSKIESHEICLEDERRLKITISIGCCDLEADSITASTNDLGAKLISTADAALYQAKETGRNRVCYQTLNTDSTQ